MERPLRELNEPGALQEEMMRPKPAAGSEPIVE
jgi:hypothetical protein